ncbi:MAG: TRAP transporter small permease [Betaproteobacteria bacterium]
MAVWIDALDRTLARFEDMLLGAAIATGTVLTCTQVVLRYVFSSGIDWSEEVTIYAAVWAAFVGAAAGLRLKSHLIVDALVMWAPPRLSGVLANAGLVVTLLFGCAFAWYSGSLVARTQQLGQLTPALQVPMWIVYLVMPLSGVLLALRALLLLSGRDSAPREPAKT